MNNKDVCNYISQLPEHKTDKDYYAERIVKNGLGQTTGGYIEAGIKSQKDHFRYYYGNIPDKKPTYNYLRCPQLILFIAEVFEVPDDALEKAYNLIKEYEKNEKSIKTLKNGNYFWGKQIFIDFKKALKIGEVNKIICNKDNIEKIKEEVKELFK